MGETRVYDITGLRVTSDRPSEALVDFADRITNKAYDQPKRVSSRLSIDAMMTFALSSRDKI